MGVSLVSFNQNLYKLSCEFTQNGDNKTYLIRGKMSEETRAHKSHIPKDSFFFERVVPISLVLMGVITLGLILFAMGVLFGFVQF